MTTFYTYLWLREDGTPYYVGKGTYARAHRKRHPKGQIILQAHLCEVDAFAVEKFLIAYYGRKDLGTGILRNRTDGGEGVGGRQVSEATRNKIRETLKGHPVSVETRKRISLAPTQPTEGMTGRHHSEDTKNKLRREYCKRGHLRIATNLTSYGQCRQCLTLPTAAWQRNKEKYNATRRAKYGRQ